MATTCVYSDLFLRHIIIYNNYNEIDTQHKKYKYLPTLHNI